MNIKTLNEFYSVTEDLVALYYDAIRGFRSNYYITKSKYLDQQEDKIIYPERFEDLDDSGVETLYGNKEMYQCTVKDYKERNGYNGKNHCNIGNLIACQLYAYWEDYYRKEIAQDLKLNKGDLMFDIFGDLKYLRHSILHHGAIALNTVENCKILKWYKTGDLILIHEFQFDSIITHVRTVIDFLHGAYKRNHPRERYLAIQTYWNDQ